MSFLDNSNHVIGHSNPKTGCSPGKQVFTIDFEQEFEKLALFVAETWRDDHPDAHSDSQADFEDCVAYVTAEMVKAGAAVGGAAGLELSIGGASAAAYKACRQVLPQSRDSA